MSSKIEKDFTFLASIHFEGKFVVNLYEMKALMTVNTDDVKQQQVAIERMMYFISSQIEDCIFVFEEDKEAIEKYKKALNLNKNYTAAIYNLGNV